MAIQHRTESGRAGSLFGDDRLLFDVVREVAVVANPGAPTSVSMRAWNRARVSAGHGDAPTANAICMRLNRHDRRRHTWASIVAGALAEGIERVQAHAKSVMEEKSMHLDVGHLRYALRVVSRELGRSPRDDDYEVVRERLLERERRRMGSASQLADVMPAASQVQRLAGGSWDDALKLAGLEPFKRQRVSVVRSRNSMPVPEAIVLFVKLNGRWPSMPVLQKWARDADISVGQHANVSTWWTEAVVDAEALVVERGMPVPTERPRVGRPRKGERTMSVQTYILPSAPTGYARQGATYWNPENIIAALREWDRSLPAGVNRNDAHYRDELRARRADWPSVMTITHHGGWTVLRAEALRRNAEVARGAPDEFPEWESVGNRGLLARRARADARPVQAGERKRPDGKRVRLTDLIKAGLVECPAPIYTTYKKRRYDAVIRADGRVELADGRVATTASRAGRLASGVKVNGWEAWRIRWRGKDVRLVMVRDELVRRWLAGDAVGGEE